MAVVKLPLTMQVKSPQTRVHCLNCTHAQQPSYYRSKRYVKNSKIGPTLRVRVMKTQRFTS